VKAEIQKNYAKAEVFFQTLNVVNIQQTPSLDVRTRVQFLPKEFAPGAELWPWSVWVSLVCTHSAQRVHSSFWLAKRGEKQQSDW
jgi:hypothetical protein